MIAAGERVDRYVIERLVGEGGMAEVYVARHAQLGTRHALKLLTVHRAGLPQRLLLEGRIQAQLRHPHVVMVTDVVEHGGRTGLVLEFIDGQTLEALLHERGRLPVDEALRLFAAVLSGVGAAHAAGVLHRDIKPGNILLARVGDGVVPKVTDFGIAKLVMDAPGGERLTVDGTAIGTPGYMAPEQFRRGATVDQRADVFALGALLYEMLGGRPAFAGDSLAEVLTAAASARFVPLAEVQPEVPERVSAAVAKALSPEPEDRFADCAAFADALFDPGTPERALLGGGTPLPMRIEARPRSASAPTLALPTASLDPLPPAPAEPAPKFRMPLAGWIAFLVMAALVFGLVAWAVMRNEPEASPVAAAEPAPVAPVEAPPLPLPGAEAVTPPADPGTAPVTAPAAPVRPAATPAAVASLPSAEAPAAVPVEAPVVEPTPAPAAVAEPEPAVADAAPEPVAPEAPVLPTVKGTWKGRWSGRPLTVQVSRQDGATLAGTVEVLVGTTPRTYRVSGSVAADGSFSLRDAEGGPLRLTGRFTGSALDGMATVDGRTAMSAFEAKRMP